MSERTLKQLIGALVVIVGIWLVASFLSRGGGSIRATGDIASFFDGMTRETISAMRLDGPRGSMEIRRTGGTWTTNGFEADTSSIAQLVSALGGTEVGDLAATNPANHARMGVSADSATTVEVEVDGEARSILIGDQGPRFGTAYGRLPDEDEVYVLEGDLRVQVRRPLDDWRNKEIAAVDTARVARVEIERDGDAYALVRGDSLWAFEDGSEADQTEVRGILSELDAVIAAGFLTVGDSLFAQPEGGSNVAYSADGEVLARVTIGSGDGERWARTPGDSIVYRLSTFRVGRLAPTLEEMRPGS